MGTNRKTPLSPAAKAAAAKSPASPVLDVDATLLDLRTRLDAAQGTTESTVFDAAKAFDAIVTKGSMSQGDYADALWGHKDKSGDIIKGTAKSQGTWIKRLSIAAVRLEFTPGSLEWTFLVQKATAKVAGDAVSLANKRSAQRAVTVAAAEWNAGNSSKNARTPKPASAKDGDKDASKGDDETPEAPKVATLDDLLAAIGEALKGQDQDTCAHAVDTVVAFAKREAQIRKAAAAQVA